MSDKPTKYAQGGFLPDLQYNAAGGFGAACDLAAAITRETTNQPARLMFGFVVSLPTYFGVIAPLKLATDEIGIEVWPGEIMPVTILRVRIETGAGQVYCLAREVTLPRPRDMVARLLSADLIAVEAIGRRPTASSLPLPRQT